ncbi:MAG: hypothetical protein U0559_02490 [Anaerolineae bacterium]
MGSFINALADVLPKRHAKWRLSVCGLWPDPIGQPCSGGCGVHRDAYCPSCDQTIAVRNPIVEVSTAALFALLFTRFSDPIVLVLASFHTSVLMLLTVTDLEHRLIRILCRLPAIAIAALTSFLWFGPGWYLALVGGVIGYVFFLAGGRPGQQGV